MSQKSPLAPDEMPKLAAVKGVSLATAASGMKYQGRDDVLLMVFDPPAAVAGVMTRSSTAAASVDWCREVLKQGEARALLVNAGNANAFTGIKGETVALNCASAVASALSCPPQQILLASTGVIGEPMDHSLITSLVPQMVKSADNTGDDNTDWQKAAWRAAEAILTTDTFAKAASRTTSIGGVQVRITGIAKGSGMIAPDMATMLGFIVTDAKIDASVLRKLLLEANEHSFNSITVDSDTSTNDTVIVAATGKADNPAPTSADDSLLVDFKVALHALMVELACLIVRDGEGASKFITITINGAESEAAARRVGLAVGNSPLVKTAIAGGDANWGRIVMAVGKSGEKIIRDRLEISIGGVKITENGARHPDYREELVAEHMKGSEISIKIDLNLGDGAAVVWSCDLTKRYIEINADYRS